MTTGALPVHVAIVDETGTIEAATLAKYAGALNEQIAHDFAPVWKVRASVGAYPKAPAGCWAVKVQRTLDQPGALGYHTDDGHQPYALVELTDTWTVTVSHETLEMLADPWGSRMHAARLPLGLEQDYRQFGLAHPSSRVHYLVEVCDPPEETSYDVGGFAVSDFLTDKWYRSAGAFGVPYSHAGGIQSAREVASGGYVSFSNSDGEWYQAFADGIGQLSVQDIGRFNKAEFGSLREWTDLKSREFRANGSGKSAA